MLSSGFYIWFPLIGRPTLYSPHQYCIENIKSMDKMISTIFRYAVSVRWEREQAEQRGQPSESSGPIMERKPALDDFNALFCCCARRVGSMFFLVETKDGSPIVVAGPCWPFCTFVTTPLIFIFSGMVGYFIVSNPNTKLVRCFLRIY
jgi:hypothetical protein